jgi:acetyltransferase-like isoleucine patch superfamily enzyme
MRWMIAWLSWQRRRYWLWRNSRGGCLTVPRDCQIDRSVIIDWAYGGNITIGAKSVIKQGVILAPYGGSICVEEEVFIGPGCVLYGHGTLRIGKGTLVAAHAVFVPANHVFERTDIPIQSQGITTTGITIGSDCWLGSGVRVLDGVAIGDGCVIGAGAVVTRSLPAYSVAVGVPAKVVRQRKETS